MTQDFRLLRIHSKAELDRYGVKEFAEEFGHKPIGLPIILIFHKDDLVAYVEVRQTPVLYPAVHPKIIPRAFLEAGRMIVAIMREELEGSFMIYDRRSALFEPEAMEHLGLQLSPLKFFEPKEIQNGSQSA
jgi:hypothetical protein